MLITRYHEVRGLRLAHHRWGDSPPGVVAVHGFLDHGRSFRRTAERLEAGRLVALDMRGFGESGWVGDGGYYHFYDYYDDVVRFLRTFAPAPVGLVGHSMGGSICSAVAGLVPDLVKWVLLLEGMGPRASDLSRSAERLDLWLAALARPQLGGPSARRSARPSMPSVAAAAERLRAYNRRLSEEHSLELAQSNTEPHGDGVAWRHDPLHRTPSAKPYLVEESTSVWRRVRAPVISLWGEGDAFVPDDLSERVAALAEYRTGRVPDAGHNIHHDRPDVVAAAIRHLDSGAGGLPDGVMPS